MMSAKRYVQALALTLAAAVFTACNVPTRAPGEGSAPAGASSGGQAAFSTESANSGASRAESTAQGSIYLVPLYDQSNFTAVPRYVALDAAGNEILRGGDMLLLTDLYTGKPYAITVQRGEKTGAPDAYGNEGVQYYSQLYDTDGKLLSDWAPCVYTAAFGQWVISSSQPLVRAAINDAGTVPEGYHSGLVDMDTGEVALPDVAMLAKQADGSLLQYDGRGIVTAILDDGLNVKATPPAGSRYASLQAVQGGYIAMCTSEDGAMYALLLDTAFQPLTDETAYTYIDAAGAGYVVANASGEDGTAVSRVLRVSDGAVVYQTDTGGSVIYYDGARMLSTYTGGQGQVLYRLLDADGNLLAGGYTIMGTMPANGEYTTETFYAGNGQTLAVLDTGGNELYRMDAGGAQAITWQGGAGVFLLEQYGEDSAGNSWMVDAQLTPLVEPGRYSSIYPVWGTSTLLNAMQAIGGVYSYTLHDVLDLRGNVLVGDLRNIYYADDERLSVQKGFYVGLMDLRGNWLWKTSAFGTLQD